MTSPENSSASLGTENSGESSGTQRGKRRVLAIVLLHLLAAIGWWYIMPQGFPLGHAKWWANLAFPVIVLLACLGSVVRIRFAGSWNWATRAALACSAVWCGAAATLAILFPASGLTRAPFVAAVGAYGIWSAKRTTTVREKQVALLCAGLSGFVIGALAVALQRSPRPATQPMNTALPIISKDTTLAGMDRPMRLGQWTQVAPREGEVKTQLGYLQLTIQPMLQFESRSPDRFWTSFAPRSGRISPPTVLSGIVRTENEVAMSYLGDYPSTVRVMGRNRDTDIEAKSALSLPIYSHLNSYCYLLVSGHRRLFVRFSACPNERIEVFPSDYPIGRAARAAYIGEDGLFRVVEARSAEKGPFRVLAQGPMRRGDPLSIDFIDNDRYAGRVTWLEWSAQVDMSLSPTAGWGLPNNAIQFSLAGDNPDDAAVVYLTLASTSMGRGWDSVGHAEGIYSNQMRVESARSEND